MGDPKGAVHFDAWLKKTRFYQDICPNWSRDQEGPEAEANAEVEAEASLADAHLDSLRDAAWLQESPEEEGGGGEGEEEGEEEGGGGGGGGGGRRRGRRRGEEEEAES